MQSHLQDHGTCAAWMQTLLRGSSVPISQQGELEWGELLTNRYKLQLYLQQLQQQLPLQNPTNQKHLKLLIFLLTQLQKQPVTITATSHTEIKAEFDSNRLLLLELEQHERVIEEQKQQIKTISRQYQGIIMNMNGVIEMLVKRQKQQ